MEKLLFSLQWHANKLSSWSGSYYSIYKQISKSYDLVEFDYGIRKPYTFINKLILNKIFNIDSDYKIQKKVLL